MSAILTNPRTDSGYAALIDLPIVVAGNPPTGGTGTLSGVVTVSGVAASRVVQIRDDATLALAGATVSAVDGTWSVTGLTRTRPLRLIVLGEAGERDVTVSGLYAT